MNQVRSLTDQPVKPHGKTHTSSIKYAVEKLLLAISEQTVTKIGSILIGSILTTRVTSREMYADANDSK